MNATNPPPERKPARRAPIPVEFVLHAKIVWRFRAREQNGWIPCSKTEITRHFLYRRRKGALTPQEFSLRVLPGWILRGLAREVPRPGKPPAYEFRRRTVAETDDRLREITKAFTALYLLYTDLSKPEYRRGDTRATLCRLQAEIAAMKMERLAKFDENLRPKAAAA